MKATATLPCGSCVLCCTDNQAVVLHPEDCDDPRDYGTVIEAPHPLYPDRTIYMLPHKADGSCTFLGPFGCSIYAKRPAICRTFDCRRFALRVDEVKAEVAKSKGTARLGDKVLTKGREMLKKHPL